MEIVHDPKDFQKRMMQFRAEGKAIGFVPTMGALHAGHIALAERARASCDILVVSIFVNPLQFAPSEDLDKYPRTLGEDARKAEAVGVDLIFSPSPRDMYPAGFGSTVSCGAITTRLEGAARPGHFDGVTTVVLKLFNIVLPNFAVFGQKDAQQALVIRRMVEDLNIPVELIIHPTVRESDGLAMSSRNVYLTKEEREEAPLINKGLRSAYKVFCDGNCSARKIRSHVEDIYAAASFLSTEYVAVTDTFCNDISGEISCEALLSVVCRTKISGTRLIDNILLV